MTNKQVTMKNNKIFIILAAFIAGFIALNIIAYMQVYKMTHFAAAGIRTEKPEEVTFFRKIMLLFTGITIPKPANHITPADYKMPFSSVYFPGFDNLKLEAWYIPNNKTSNNVIMFHGYAGSKEELLPEAKEFHDKGFSLFLVDFYGSGGSAGNTTSIGLNEAVDVKNSVEFVKQNYKPKKIYIYSISMGSAASLRAFAELGTTVNAAVMECPFSSLLQTVKNRFVIMKVPSFFLAEMLVFYGGIQQNFNAFNLNPAEYAKKVNVPVLILLGDRDKRVTVNEGQMVFDNLRGKKEFKIFKNGGHVKFIESHRTEWEQNTMNFINQF